MRYDLLLEEVEQYIERFFNEHINEALVYHNRKHTRSVVKAAETISNHYGLNERDRFIVLTSAWFHDIGYYFDPQNHEEAGAKLAETVLHSKGADIDTINAVRRGILATRLFHPSSELLEQIVADADLFHLGTDDFADANKLMRKEYGLLHHTETDKAEWRKKTIGLLEKHQYQTEFARNELTQKKAEHLARLRAKDSGAAPPNHEPRHEVVGAPVDIIAEKEDKANRPARGIETMFRISSANHQRLSDMADSKAQIMITVNSIIISVLLSGLLRSLEEFPHLTFPVILLVAVNVVTIVFSVLSTRPTLPKGIFTRDEVKEKKVNLLFFGNFYNMNLEDYNYGMQEMMKDKEFLYGSLIKDGYAQGVVLGKKYNLLRISYNVFMFGLIASVLAFIIASIFFRPAQ